MTVRCVLQPAVAGQSQRPSLGKIVFVLLSQSCIALIVVLENWLELHPKFINLGYKSRWEPTSTCQQTLATKTEVQSRARSTHLKEAASEWEPRSTFIFFPFINSVIEIIYIPPFPLNG